MKPGKYLFFLLMSTTSLMAQNQTDKNIKNYTLTLQANTNGWLKSSIKVHKGDFVVFQSGSRYNLGAFTKNVDASGSGNFLLAIYSRNPKYGNGALLCRNAGSIEGARHGATLLQGTSMRMPAALQNRIDMEHFVGNYFVSGTDQELSFILNDKKIDDNDGELLIKVTVLTGQLPLDENFDLAGYVDAHKGVLPYCFSTDIIPPFSGYIQFSNGLWFSGGNENGHTYITLNKVGHYDVSLAQAMDILSKNISKIFPNGATDVNLQDNPELTTIQYGHHYQVFNNYFPIPPKVIAIETSRFHFTFEAEPHHVLKGTAIHGLFMDQCGDLYMFQQGKGVPDEVWNLKFDNQEYNLNPRGTANKPLAFLMWHVMAGNLAKYLTTPADQK